MIVTNLIAPSLVTEFATASTPPPPTNSTKGVFDPNPVPPSIIWTAVTAPPFTIATALILLRNAGFAGSVQLSLNVTVGGVVYPVPPVSTLTLLTTPLATLNVPLRPVDDPPPPNIRVSVYTPVVYPSPPSTIWICLM